MRFLPVFCALFAALLLPARAAIVEFVIYTGYDNDDPPNLYALYGADGITPLANGSYVMIVGTADTTVDRANNLHTWAGTNLQSEIIDGTVIGQFPLITSDGTFFSQTYYINDAEINYVYFYFFEQSATNTMWPVEGWTEWGYSDYYDLDDFYFGELGYMVGTTNSYTADQANQFVAIPEPSTGALLVFCAGMLFLGFPGFARSLIRRPVVSPEIENGGGP